MRRDLIGFMVRVARESGDIAWSRQGVFKPFIVSGPEQAHEVLVDKADAFVKSYALSVFARPLLGDGLLTAEHETHRLQRRRLAPAFAHKRVATYADAITARADSAASELLERGRFDFTEEMMKMTLAIVGETLFGTEVGSDAEAIGDALTQAMQHMIDSLLSLVPVPPAIPTPRNRRARGLVARLDAIVYRIIEARRKSDSGGVSDRGDVLSILLAPDEDGVRMSDREVRDQVMTLLLAGHETTANALSWTFGELSRHPAVRARVEAEADALAGHENLDTFERLQRLPVCLRVLKESMRLHPPAYTVGRLSTRSVTIGGETLKKRQIVLVNIVGMQRRADLFPDPDHFDPDRFSPEREKSIPRRAYIPFGDGPRVCIGNQFALMEGQLAIATLARRVRLSLEGPLPGNEPLVTLRPRGGMPMHATAR